MESSATRRHQLVVEATSARSHCARSDESVRLRSGRVTGCAFAADDTTNQLSGMRKSSSSLRIDRNTCLRIRPCTGGSRARFS